MWTRPRIRFPLPAPKTATDQAEKILKQNTATLRRQSKWLRGNQRCKKGSFVKKYSAS